MGVFVRTYQQGYRVTHYRAKDGWRWRLRAPNNRIVADSGEAYSSKSGSLRAFTTMHKALRRPLRVRVIEID